MATCRTLTPTGCNKLLMKPYKGIRQALEENKDNLIPALLISVYGDRLEDQYVGNYLETYAYKDNGCLNEVNQYMAALKRKAIGSMFTDFTMDDMEGTPHKLSDYVGKGTMSW